MKKSLEAPLILIVDDEEDIRDGSERILTRSGFTVFKASQGEEALRIMETQDIPIVLLDLKMPGLDGMEVLKWIRERDGTTVVIVITGYATVETAIEAIKQGAYDFIPKPFQADHLRIVVGRAWEKLKLVREARALEQERRRNLLDLDAEKSRLRAIVESLPTGVAVTNAEGKVVLMNPAFRSLLGLDPAMAPEEMIGADIANKELNALVVETSRGTGESGDQVRSCEVAVGGEKHLLAECRCVRGEENECLGAVVTLVDITAMKALDRIKSEFVAKVSHELRSPLSTIHEQLAQVLKDMGEGSSSQGQYLLTRAQEKTLGLISLVGDLLDLTRIEEGSFFREPKPVRLDYLLGSIVDFMSAKSRARNQELSLCIPPEGLPPITADAMALESIFGNLVSNALNYTPDGGRIRVEAGLEAGRIKVSVEDNGVGMEAKHLEKIFERFYRVRNAKTKNVVGTGLGLPIVKALVETLQGSVDVKSSPGEGSVFTVRLPLERRP